MCSISKVISIFSSQEMEVLLHVLFSNMPIELSLYVVVLCWAHQKSFVHSNVWRMLVK